MSVFKRPMIASFILLMLGMTIWIPRALAQYKTYEISYYSYAQFSSSGEASIDLFDENKNMTAILIFLPTDASLLPVAYHDVNDGLIRMYYTIENLQSVVDLLRFESPIVLNFWLPSGNNSHIASKELERVGESE